ncbi:SDR family NAD(P)-dependent oxidoreductase [Vibrio rhizosphaerae]|uniref:SDR family NAD(P)-dependent oxidoreductase n=1 Tax=Vibrio rhizosphaerae TaxID=398736 RepID=UPI00146FBC8F|nr:SDR family NAD(P)-dependent oxidoreductase [Vibrio rhizosphaerae]
MKNSILKIQEKDQRIQALEGERDKPIAVIGLSCRFPGASNPESFWQLIRNGENAVTTMTDQRWDMAEYFSPLVGEPGKISTCHFGLLKDIDQFDPSAFGISEEETPYLDPQHRLLLEQAWHCFERAGFDIMALRGSDTGVFVGQMNSDYTNLIKSTEDLNAYVGQGNALSAASGRLSYVFGLNGPSVSVDTACSSSLVAVHLACQSLRMGECSTALAGGVNLLLSPEAAIGASVAHMLSVRGRCNTFGDGADGYVRSEGCGLVLLKTLEQAEKDGDKILAVIRGSAVNQDGRSHGLNAPNGPAQMDVIRQALSQAKLDPAEVNYLEAHGTGTALGDPVEVQAVDQVYGQAKGRTKPLVMGAVKANIGHCESAAGVAGLIKLIQMVQGDVLPPITHLEQLNPHFDGLSESLVFPKGASKDGTSSFTWHDEQSRIAAVSSFGYTGTNVHMIVSQHSTEKDALNVQAHAESSKTQSQAVYPFYFSAHSITSLRQQLSQFRDFLKETPHLSLPLISGAVNSIRNHFAYRFGCHAATRQELLSCLVSGIQGEYSEPLGKPTMVACFGPSNSQYPIPPQIFASDTWCSYFRCIETRVTQATEFSIEALMSSQAYPTLRHLISQLSYVEHLVEEGAEIRKVQASGTGTIAALVFAKSLTLEQAADLCVRLDQISGADLTEQEQRVEADIRYLIQDIHLKEAQRQIFVKGHDSTRQDVDWVKWPYHNVSEAKQRLLEALLSQQHPYHWSMLDSEIGIDVSALQIFPQKTIESETQPSWINLRINLFNRGATLRWDYTTIPQDKSQYPVLPDYVFARRRYWLPPQVTERVASLPSMFSTVGHSIFTTVLAVPDGGSLYAGELALSRLPFLRDHLVAGEIVLPASVYINLIAEVCVGPDGLPANIVQIQISQACILDSQPIGVYCRVDPTENGIAKVEIYTTSERGKWTKHVSAQVNVGFRAELNIKPLADVRKRCSQVISVEQHLLRAKQSGIEYGPSFQAIRQLYSGSGVALAKIEWPSDLPNYWSGCGLHPVMLDACFQVISGAMGTQNSDRKLPLYVPTELHEMHLQGNSAESLWCFVQILAPDEVFHNEATMYDYLSQQEKLSVALYVYDEQGKAILSIKRFEASKYRPELKGALWQEWLLEKQWIPCRFSSEKLDVDVSALLTQAQSRFSTVPYTMSVDMMQDLDALSGHFIHRALTQFGFDEQFFTSLLTAHTLPDEMLEQYGILPDYQRLLKKLVSLSEHLPVSALPADEIESKLRSKLGEETHELDLFVRCGNALAEVLQGQTKAVDLLFEAGHSQGTEALYQDSPGSLLLNQRIATLVAEAVSQIPSGRRLRILEVGAGTGATTQQVLEQVDGKNIDYVFTDISPHFLMRAKEKFGAFESVDYRIFDLQQNPLEQEFTAGAFDVVIAVNVLHATADLTQTLNHLSLCLADGGLLLLREVTEQQAWLDLSFGMTPGWWSYTDTSLRQNGPLLNTEEWQTLLHDSGFESTLVTDELERTESIFIAEKIASTTDVVSKGCYLVLGDEDTIETQGLNALKNELAQRGLDWVFISLNEFMQHPRFQELDAFSTLLMSVEAQQGPIIGLVYAWSMSPSDLNCDDLLEKSERYLKYPLLLCQTLLDARWRHLSPSFLTAGAQPRDHKVAQPLQAMVWGHVFTYINENAAFARLIDLDGTSVSGECLYEALTQKEECQLVVREGQLCAARLKRATLSVPEAPAQRCNIVADGTYVITGGFGDLGLQTAQKLVEQGAQNLILIGRRERRDVMKTLDMLREQGVNVVPLYVDVSDGEALNTALNQVLDELPMIRGVVHSVGVLDDGVIEKQRWERYLKVLKPKVFGAIHLYEAVSGYDLDFFVIYSSAAAVMGNPGQANHAAANAFLDAFAWYLRGQGCPGLAIGWGAWSEIGAAAARGITARLTQNQSIAGTISPEQGADLIAKQFASKNVQFTVLPIDFDRKIDTQYLPQVQRLLSSLLKSNKSGVQQAGTAPDNREKEHADQFVQDLLQMDEAQRQRQVENYLQGTLVKLLKQHGNIEHQTSLFELGLDSLLAIDLRSLLENQFRQKFESTLLYDYPTIHSLTEFLLQCVSDNHGQQKTPFTHHAETLSSDPATKTADVELQGDDAIAVVGMSCRFPGGANSIGEYWELLKNGVDAVQPIPETRWDHSRYYDPDKTQSGKIYVAEGCFIDEVAQFCPERFGIAGIEADLMDPQQRLLLDVCYEALESAGQNPMGLGGSETGVFMGVMTQDYLHLTQHVRENAFYVGTGSANSVVAGRVSHVFGLMGPTMTLDTACSSSLVGVQMACTNLRSGACDMAIAGGVSLQLSPEPLVIECAGGMLSPSGHCRTFDASADGFVRGEGCGVVVLKRLADAKRDRDPIVGVIRGGAVNHDGRAGGLTVPSGLSQQKVLEKALHDAQLSPSDISYIEAHGTGTHLGDPLELNALQAVFSESRDKAPLYVGSVKTNIGHAEAAAGVAGLIKVLLCLKHETFVPHLHFEQPNPNFDWEQSNIQVTTSLHEWTSKTKRRAGVSSFGLSGTNAHLVVEEFQEMMLPRKQPSEFVPLVALSHINPTQLKRDAARYHQLLTEDTPLLMDAAYTFCISRTGQSVQAVFPAQTQEALLAGLKRLADGELDIVDRKIKRPRLEWQISVNQRAAWMNQACTYYDLYHLFRGTIDASVEALKQRGFDVLSSIELCTLKDGSVDENIALPEQVRLAILNVAYGRLLLSLGIAPECIQVEGLSLLCVATLVGVSDIEQMIDGMLADSDTELKAILAGIHFSHGHMRMSFKADRRLSSAVNERCDSICPKTSVDYVWGDSDISLDLVRSAVNGKAFTELHQLLSMCSSLGLDIDWYTYFSPVEPHRIALPSSHFPTRRYWVNESLEQEQTRQVPLISQDITAAVDGCRYVDFHLSVEHQVFLDEHRLSNTRILPAAGSLAFILHAHQCSYPLEMKGVRLVRPVHFESQLSVQLAMKPTGRTELFYCEPTMKEWHVFATMEAIDMSESSTERALITDDNQLLSTFHAVLNAPRYTMDKETFYQASIPRELNLGESYRLIEEVQGDGLCLVARIRNISSEFVLDPRVLDACIQSVNGVGDKLERQSDGLFLPYAIQSISIHDWPSGSHFWCMTQFLPENSHADELVYDITVVDEHERICARFEHASFRKVNVPMVDSAKPETSIIHQLRWQPSPLRNTESVNSIAIDAVENLQNVLLIGKANAVQQRLQEQLSDCACHQVDAAEAARQSVDELRLLLDECSKAGAFIYTELLEASDRSPHDVEILTQDIWYLQQWLVAASKQGKPFIVLTRTGQSVCLNDVPLSAASVAAAALVQTAVQEFPSFPVLLIDLDDLSTESEDGIGWLAEITPSVQDSVVAYREGKRYRSVLEAVHSIEDVSCGNSVSPVKPNRTYIITGGLGDIGLLTAEKLVSEGATSLVLMSRNEHTNTNERIEALRNVGCQVEIRLGDVSDMTVLQAHIEQMTSCMPPVAGIFHTAAISANALMTQQTAADWADVLSVKVQGALNLLEMSREMELDCFVLFSSIASIGGSIGQSNYAVANAFLDYFAQSWSQLGVPVMSINWGAWENTGMAGRAEAKGIGFEQRLSPEQALSSLCFLMQNPRPQVVCFRENRALNTSGLELSGGTSLNEELKHRLFGEAFFNLSADEQNNTVSQTIRSILSDFLKVDPDHIKDEQPFFDCGMDSITAVDFSHQVGEVFGVELHVDIVFDYPNLLSLADYVLQLLLQDVPSFDPVISGEDGALVDTLSRLSVDEKQHHIKRTIRNILCEFLKVDGSHIKDEQPFFDLGMDSITAVEFSRHVGEAFALELHVDIIFDYPNLSTLTTQVMELLSFDVSPQPISEDVTIEQLSKMLEQELENDA